jgi:adenylate cyclase class 2
VIEAELKARVMNPESVRQLLIVATGEPEHAEYADTYFDRSNELSRESRELRIRTISTTLGVRHILTYKGSVLDEASGSKAEAETAVEDRDAAESLLSGLGYAPTIAFTKKCENYRLTTVTGRPVLATLVTMPELNGTFLEVETMADSETDMRIALDELRVVLLDLGISPSALTTELYTDAVKAARGTSEDQEVPEGLHK